MFKSFDWSKDSVDLRTTMNQSFQTNLDTKPFELTENSVLRLKNRSKNLAPMYRSVEAKKLSLNKDQLAVALNQNLKSERLAMFSGFLKDRDSKRREYSRLRYMTSPKHLF